MAIRRTLRTIWTASAFVALAAAVAAPAAATVISMDDSTYGVGSITLDTVTGLEWLDWTQTTGMSVNQVMAELGPGGAFQGFHLATQAEVNQFFTDAGIPDVPGITAANLAPVQALLQLVGITGGASSSSPYAVAWMANVNPGNGLRYIAALQDRTGIDGLGQATTYTTVTGTNDDSAFGNYGSVLVRSVPEPCELALLAAALLALIVTGTAPSGRRSVRG